MPVVQLTLQEACAVLEPPMSEPQLRIIVRALAIQPTGRRHNGQAGRPIDTFEAADLMRLHAALTPWLKPLPGVSLAPPADCRKLNRSRRHARNQGHAVDSCQETPCATATGPTSAAANPASYPPPWHA